MASFTQQALRILDEERRVAQVEEQKRIAAAEAEAAAKAQAERAVRVQLQAERELARIAAERALAEEQAVALQAADARALQAELARLRARSEMDILRDEVAQMRAEQMATLKAYHLARVPQQEIHLRSDGELDMRFKSSKEELATARGEIAELKALVRSLCVATHLQFKRSAPAGFYQNYDPRTDPVEAHLNALSKPAEDILQAARDEANAAARAMLKK
jgi:hypothetical protein